jgi:hypothetical protein
MKNFPKVEFSVIANQIELPNLSNLSVESELRKAPTIHINSYINELLSYTNEGFETFFRDKASEIIDYFANCPIWMSLEQWLFHEGNMKPFSSTTKNLIKQIRNRSKRLGYTFIRQYELADKLKITSSYVGKIIKNLQSLALIHKGHTNKIHYSLIFDLKIKVTSYIESVVNILFDYYSKKYNIIASSVASSVTLTDFSLVNVVYTGICEIKEASQSNTPKIHKTY